VWGEEDWGKKRKGEKGQKQLIAIWKRKVQKGGGSNEEGG